MKNELQQHNPELLGRPSLLLLTKVDLLPKDSPQFNKIMHNVPQIVISSISGHNINQAIKGIADIIQSLPQDSAAKTT